MEQRANIKFCFKLDKILTETVELMRQIYRDDCLLRMLVFMRYSCSKAEQKTNDDSKSGRPKGVTIDELNEKVREIITVDSNIAWKILAEEFSASKDSI